MSDPNSAIDMDLLGKSKQEAERVKREQEAKAKAKRDKEEAEKAKAESEAKAKKDKEAKEREEKVKKDAEASFDAAAVHQAYLKKLQQIDECKKALAAGNLEAAIATMSIVSPNFLFIATFKSYVDKGQLAAAFEAAEKQASGADAEIKNAVRVLYQAKLKLAQAADASWKEAIANGDLKQAEKYLIVASHEGLRTKTDADFLQGFWDAIEKGHLAKAEQLLDSEVKRGSDIATAIKSARESHLKAYLKLQENINETKEVAQKKGLWKQALKEIRPVAKLGFGYGVAEYSYRIITGKGGSSYLKDPRRFIYPHYQYLLLMFNKADHPAIKVQAGESITKALWHQNVQKYLESEQELYKQCVVVATEYLKNLLTTFNAATSTQGEKEKIANTIIYILQQPYAQEYLKSHVNLQAQVAAIEKWYQEQKAKVATATHAASSSALSNASAAASGSSNAPHEVKLKLHG